MRRIVLLIAAGSLWLFLAAIPVFADGGPHVSSINNGTTSLSADSCAGCHRAHTAQGEALLVATDEQALCLSCHNATANGASTDVVTGVQYVNTSVAGGKAGGTILGYLRDGGFQQAHRGSATGEVVRVGYYRAQDTISAHTKVPAEVAAENVTSSHLDLIGNAAVTGPKVIWGYGVANATAPAADISCASCHNPHGNGQYRILNTLNTSSDVVNATATTIGNVYASTDRIFTVGSNNLIAGDVVNISGTGNAALPDGVYVVKSIAGNAFTVAASPNKVPADITGATVNITADSTGGTVKRFAAFVADAPLPAAGDNRNYTIIQVRGTQGTDASYMLYQSDVLDAESATPAKTWPIGTYSSTAGDYFHRTVPWDPAITEPTANCDTANPPANGTCSTANDAPNGHPATSTSGGTAGQIAYNDQITAWCSTCHTRYYSATNPNPTGDEPSSSADTAKTIASISGNNIVSPAGATFGFAVGDVVTFSGGAAGNQYSVITSATAGTGAAAVQTITISQNPEGAVFTPTWTGGTATRLYPFSASSWYFPRPTDTTYKYQHQTTTNRACTTCHVGHGSDAQMPGFYSGSLAFPNGTAATAGFNSRLLKIDNRGTCQACHDPTNTSVAGVVLGNTSARTAP